ncbi:MAG TPA: MEDS domain-containing protein [Candidatus Acidoferrales bacterium]|jgi:PAS domain S-box-containing protein|nr:MEDS domain-containing protein [Candidatus Acidoferrales bacterium]
MSTSRAQVSDDTIPLGSALSSDSAHDGHTVQFYGEDAVLLDELSRFIGDSLEAEGSAVVVATAAHRQGLEQRLEARGIDTVAAAEQGRFVSLDATETLSKFMLEGWPDPVGFGEVVGGIVARAKEAARNANGRLAIFGEMVALLWAQGKFGTAIQLERYWNRLRQTHFFALRCAYPMAGFNREDHSEQFLKICSEHSHVIPGESYMALTTDEERLRNISLLQQRAQALDVATAERKEAQKILRQRESELTDLLENALEGVQRTGPDQKIAWANKAVLKLLGYAPEEYIGHRFDEFFVNQGTFDDFWAKLMRREEVYDYPAELRGKSGAVVHVVIHSNGLWEGETFVHTRTFIHNMTERRAMEQALQQAHDDLEKRVRERTDELRKKNIQVLKQAEILDMTNQGLRELSARLLRVQDEERRRIARDLHDSTGQSLALLSMNLSAMEAEASKSNPGLLKSLVENEEIVRQISTELRTLSYLLHPPLLEEMGLESALRWYVDGFRQRSNIQITLDLSADLGRLSQDLEIALFRVIQECLTNIHRHSESPTASIRVSRYAGGINLEVRDEGKGISPEKLAKIISSGESGVGLRGMRERIKGLCGDLEIESDSKGTGIRVTIPVTAPEPGLRFLGERNAIGA